MENALAAATPGQELRVLLHPLAPETFVHDYWAKQPLHIRGTAEKFRDFFDAEAFNDALSARAPMHADFVRASFDRKTPAGGSAEPRTPQELVSTVFRANPDQALQLYDAGATLCVSQLELRVPALAAFLAAIKRQLGFPGNVSFNAYLSPPGSGFNWHFDSRIACTLQIEGTKRWRFSRTPAIAWPRANGSLRGDGVAQYADPGVALQPWEELAQLDLAAVDEAVLEPGDVLVLPAGTWHEACAGEGPSLGLNLTFSPISYTALVRGLLDRVLTPEAGWRGPGAVLAGTRAGEVDPDGIAAISAQLARAAGVLQSLSGDSTAVVRLWESFVQTPSPGSPAPNVPRVAAAAVEATQRLRVRRDGNVYAMLSDGGTCLCVTIGSDRELELTGPAIPFVQRILAERSFTAADCCHWSPDAAFAWPDVQKLLTDLKHEGLIEDADEVAVSLAL
jgi:ribosomal protein L16 Arg81 hydroxylase